MMISEPEPTDVMPTTRPPTMPTSTVRTGRRRHPRRRIDAGALHRPAGGPVGGPPTAGDEVLVGADDQAGRREQQRDAERHLGPLLHAGAGPSARDTSTPPNAAGTEPRQSRPTSRRFTVPRRRCTKPPTGFITAEHHEVAGDRGQRRDAEEQHEHRGHQRAAAHAGHADDDADQQAGHDQRQLQVHARPPSSPRAGSGAAPDDPRARPAADVAVPACALTPRGPPRARRQMAPCGAVAAGTVCGPASGPRTCVGAGVRRGRG